MVSGQCPCLSLSSRAKWILAVAVILANQLLGCDGTYDIFISSSQLESYFQGTEDFSLIKGESLLPPRPPY